MLFPMQRGLLLIVAYQQIMHAAGIVLPEMNERICQSAEARAAWVPHDMKGNIKDVAVTTMSSEGKNIVHALWVRLNLIV